MNPTERELLLLHLRDSGNAIRQATAGLNDAQAAFRPASGRWSALDCLEHVIVAEDFMFRAATEKRRPWDPASSNRHLDGLILHGGTDRSQKFQAPEPAEPKGRFPNLVAALAEFEKVRARTVAYVEQCSDDLRGFSAKHPLVGTLDCYQLLLIVALHPARHALQIHEVRSDPSFPKS